MLVFEAEHPQKKYRVQVYRFAPDFHEKPEDFLSGEEMQALAHMTHVHRRQEYLQSRHALKTQLATMTGQAPSQIQFLKVHEGKPVLADVNQRNKLDFNLSHSQEYFAIALSENGWVGVDIEKIRAPQHLESIAKRFFSPAETQLLAQETNSARQTEIFAKFWSGKEALIKAAAGGVFKHVHDVQIDENSWTIKKLPQEYGSLSQWELNFYDDIPGYVCSVALKARA